MPWRQQAPAILYHTTDSAAAILDGGFCDGEGSCSLPPSSCAGFSLSDTPVDWQEGGRGAQVLAVTLPAGTALADFELVEEGKPYREWCVPAELINAQGVVQLLTERNDTKAQRRRSKAI